MQNKYSLDDEDIRSICSVCLTLKQCISEEESSRLHRRLSQKKYCWIRQIKSDYEIEVYDKDEMVGVYLISIKDYDEYHFEEYNHFSNQDISLCRSRLKSR